MDVYQGELQKRYVRMSLWLLKLKLGKCANSKNIRSDMENCGNVIFNRIYQHLMATCEKIEQAPQRHAMRDVGELGVWIGYKDTAYKDMFIYLLNEIINDKEIVAAVKRDVKPPKQWYPNVWDTSMKQSNEGKKKGTISKYGKSFAEKVFTPSEQEATFKRMNKKRK